MATPIKTFLIPNEVCRKVGIAAKWNSINNLGVYPSQLLKCTLADQPSQYASETPSSVFLVRQEAIIFHPILRRLINEASCAFLNVQRVANSASSNIKQELLSCSISYRSIIRGCIENLRNEIMQTEGKEREELQNYITIFYSVECIWHLCEILYIENIPGYIVIKHLLEWIRFHFPKHERNAAMLLSGNLVSLEGNPDYWPTIICSLLQGRIEIVRALLSLHSLAHTQAFKLADHILKTMPVYDIYEGISINDFNIRWKHWLVNTQAKIDAKMFVKHHNLDFIMNLVVGDDNAWCQAQNYSEAWYDFLAGWLFYVEPTVKSFELGKHARKCIERMDVTMNHLDKVLLAAMEANVEIINEIQQMTENGWFVAHFIDLMYHTGQLEKWQTDESIADKLRESFILDYGTLLVGHESLWQIGLTYLDHCSKTGTAAIELLLPRIPIHSDLKLKKVIREARKRNLFHLVQSMSSVQGKRCLAQNHLGSALVWALRSQNSNFISNLADRFLKLYINNGDAPIIDSVDFVNYLGPAVLASDRLMFLYKYYEFHRLYESCQFKDAANTLMSLINSKYSPKFFWRVIILDTIPLLLCEELLISSDDTFHILNTLEERKDMLKKGDAVDLLRLACARNLSKAVIQVGPM